MVDVGDLAEVVLHHDIGGSDQFECLFGFKAINAGATFANLATAFKTAAVKNTSGGFFYGHHTSHGSASLDVRDVVPGTGAAYTYTYTRVAGANAANPVCAPVMAAVIKWSTGLAGRSYRGRTYNTGFLETEQSAGLWDSSPVSENQAFADNMVATFGPAGTDPNWQFVVISRWLNKVERAQPVGTTILAGTARNVVYTQRRRIIGKGS